jgi:hypothetical protein
MMSIIKLKRKKRAIQVLLMLSVAGIGGIVASEVKPEKWFYNYVAIPIDKPYPLYIEKIKEVPSEPKIIYMLSKPKIIYIKSKPKVIYRQRKLKTKDRCTIGYVRNDKVTCYN